MPLARLPVTQAGIVDGRHWLVVRRCLDEPHELAYFLVWAPPATPLPTMVQAVGGRWHIEEDLQEGLALGLDHYEVRSYVGWYRHITLVLLASAFLVGITVQSHLTASAPQESAACTALIPLTTSEARHEAFPSLLACTYFSFPDLSVVLVAADPPILGRLRSSPPPRESQLTLRVEPPGLPRKSPGSLPGNAPGKLPKPFPGKIPGSFPRRSKACSRSCCTFHPKGGTR